MGLQTFLKNSWWWCVCSVRW